MCSTVAAKAEIWFDDVDIHDVEREAGTTAIVTALTAKEKVAKLVSGTFSGYVTLVIYLADYLLVQAARQACMVRRACRDSIITYSVDARKPPSGPVPFNSYSQVRVRTIHVCMYAPFVLD